VLLLSIAMRIFARLILCFLVLSLWVGGMPSDARPLFGSKEKLAQTTQEAKKSYSAPPAMGIDVKKAYKAVVETTAGTLELELFANEAPKTVNNFVFLARENFYTNVIFHRVIKGFMIQGGDPTGTGRGGPGYKFEDEPVKRPYNRGILAMANAGPNTNGSQFFIMHQDYPLPPNYTIFGKLVKGEDVLDKIATAPTDSGDRPKEPVKITKVSILES
jgi:cyclophilin family peptidyl-prolyl cis-trans isomerase